MSAAARDDRRYLVRRAHARLRRLTGRNPSTGLLARFVGMTGPSVHGLCRAMRLKLDHPLALAMSRKRQRNRTDRVRA